MCHEDLSLSKIHYFFGDLVKFRGFFHHFIRDTCQCSDIVGDIFFRIDKGYKLVCDLITIKMVNRYFRNFFGFRASTGSFYVNDGIQGLYPYLVNWYRKLNRCRLG